MVSHAAKHRAKTAGQFFDNLVSVVSPKAAYKRAAFRAAYEAIDKHRTRKKRYTGGGTGDSILGETKLAELREIARDMSRNNGIAVGLLRTERDSVVGPGPKIQARSSDNEWNIAAERAWTETMLERPCDVTGRFSFFKLLRTMYLSYRRDGDAAIIFTEDGLQAVEGDQIGTPHAGIDSEFFEVINGVAYSKKTKRLIGYYIGRPNKWGYIQADSWKKYPAAQVHHLFNPERVSFSRGEPALTSSFKYLDYLTEYIDAELVAAKVNACFSVFVAKKEMDVPEAYTGGISSSGYDKDDNRLEKVEPGTIMYGEPGEMASGIGQVRPGQLFDPFTLRILTFIGRPLCIPLMLITLDFSGSTFMNARIAYQKAQETWEGEQADVVTPFASRVWLWQISRLIEAGELKPAPDDWARHEVMCRRWPYVDPFKEAKADEQQIKNATTTRAAICARQGSEFPDVLEQLGHESELLAEAGLGDIQQQKTKQPVPGEQ